MRKNNSCCNELAFKFCSHFLSFNIKWSLYQQWNGIERVQGVHEFSYNTRWTPDLGSSLQSAGWGHADGHHSIQRGGEEIRDTWCVEWLQRGYVEQSGTASRHPNVGLTQINPRQAGCVLAETAYVSQSVQAVHWLGHLLQKGHNVHIRKQQVCD